MSSEVWSTILLPSGRFLISSYVLSSVEPKSLNMVNSICKEYKMSVEHKEPPHHMSLLLCSTEDRRRPGTEEDPLLLSTEVEVKTRYYFLLK